MTAPVASGPSIRASRPSGTDGDSNGGPPFASALDGALNAGRDDGGPAATRRSPQSQQRPEGGEHRARGHDRADGRPVRQTPGTRAHGPIGPGDRGSRRAGDDEPGRTPSTRPRAGREAARSADDPSTPADPGTAVDAGVAAVIGSGIPPLWSLPTPPAAPLTAPAAGTDPTVGPPTDVAAVAGAAGQSTALVDASVSPATPGLPGLQPGSAGEDAVPAIPPADPSVATASQSPAALPGDAGATGTGGPLTRGPVPGATGFVVSSATGRRPAAPSAAAPSAVDPGNADGGSAAPPVAAVPTAAGLPTLTVPAWVRTASAAGAPPDPTAPSPAAGAPADGAGALPDPSSAVVAPSLGSGNSPSSDSGDASRQDPGVTAADPSVTVVGPPLAPAPAVAPVPASAAAAVQRPPVAAQVASQVVMLSTGPDDTHSVTVVLHPDSLGPVHVQVTLHQGTVDLTMRGAHEHGRAALMDALPDLRRDLEAAGLTCSNLGVDRDTGGSWSGQHQSAQQQAAHQQWADQGRRHQEMSDGRVRPWSRTADSGDSQQVSASTRSTSRGVDVRV
jgi:flagellar hook-length control protein FliK